MRLRALAVIVPTIGLALLLAGCPKRPMVPVASAPPPVVPTPTPPPAPAAPTPPPAPPKEYMPNDALKRINFAFDQAVIRPGDAKTLDASAVWLKGNPNQLVLIEGHCDERGTSEYNMALGDRRARAAMNYLVAQGIAADRITLISYGKERPVCHENGEACWAQNRRDEFLTKER